jgi:ADP-ribose pyrophosphatase YjhB (NUDIX family)
MRNLFSLDLVLLSPRDGEWFVCTSAGAAKSRGSARTLPFIGASKAPSEALPTLAKSLATKTVGAGPRWMTQVGAFSESTHPADTPISIAFVAVYPDGTVHEDEGWVKAESAVLPPRQKAILKATLGMLKHAVEHEPIAFHALPTTFTLRELQQVYELLLERSLHKASFRRSLAAAHLVEPTKAWRAEGRGRPAQLYKFAPKRRRGAVRGVRFELAR